MPQEISIFAVPPIVTVTSESGSSAKALWNRLLRPGLLGSSRRFIELCFELTRAKLIDSTRAVLSPHENFLRVENGLVPREETNSIALYVHFSADGAISTMVERQIATYRAAGFLVYFVTVSPKLNAPDWNILKRNTFKLIHRRNLGRDFGAWKDTLALALKDVPEPDELLLVNDSILGPIKPLDDMWRLLRSSGDGLFGLTESIGGGSHLQSYFLLCKGRQAIRDITVFFEKFKNSSSKWLIVQRGEIGLSKTMKSRGHRVSALFGYSRMVAALAANPAQKAALEKLDRRFAKPSQDPNALVKLLHDWPLNPTQHLWRELVTQFGFPFLKTDLLRRNVHNLPDLETWPGLVGPDSPCAVGTIQDHLAHKPASAA